METLKTKDMKTQMKNSTELRTELEIYLAKVISDKQYEYIVETVNDICKAIRTECIK